MKPQPFTATLALAGALLCSGCGGSVGYQAGYEIEDVQPDHPHTTSSSYETYEESPVQGDFIIWDDGSSPLVYEILSEPGGGYLQLYEGSTSFTYWPSPGFIGDDYITFWAYNEAGTSNVSTISITVWPIDYSIN